MMDDEPKKIPALIPNGTKPNAKGVVSFIGHTQGDLGDVLEAMGVSRFYPFKDQAEADAVKKAGLPKGE